MPTFRYGTACTKYRVKHRGLQHKGKSGGTPSTQLRVVMRSSVGVCRCLWGILGQRVGVLSGNHSGAPQPPSPELLSIFSTGEMLCVHVSPPPSPLLTSFCVAGMVNDHAGMCPPSAAHFQFAGRHVRGRGRLYSTSDGVRAIYFGIISLVRQSHWLEKTTLTSQRLPLITQPMRTCISRLLGAGVSYRKPSALL